MFKSILLFIVTFAMIGVAYTLYQWRDDSLPLLRHQAAMNAEIERTPVRTATAPAGDSEVNFRFRDVRVPEGDAPRIRVYDERGNARIVFQAVRWHPVRDNEFNMQEPTARLLLPGGQLAYVRGDEGQVVVQRAEDGNFNPKSGWLRGNVRIFVDRSTPEWRKAHPDLNDPESHPESIVRIWLDNVNFDLDLARLESEGDIIVQSANGTIEGTGLTLAWNEIDRHVKLLHIKRGRKATLLGMGMVGLGTPKAGKPAGTGGAADADTSPESVAETPAPAVPATAAAPPRSTPELIAAGEPRLPMVRPDPNQPGVLFLDIGRDDDLPKKDRVDTYRIIFRGDVVAEQHQGIQVASSLKADLLELVRDFGRDDRDAVEHPGSQPAPAGDNAEATSTVEAPASAPAGTEPPGSDASSIELTWTGELLITPERGSAESAPAPADAADGAAPRKKNRFHVFARGDKVEINDPNKGHAVCQELEYHDETRQVWLRGTAAEPVVLLAGDDQELRGEIIYLDEKSGLARIDGRGSMVDRGGGEENRASKCPGLRTRDEEASADSRLAWNRSAIIEFALKEVEVVGPDGQTVRRNVEYLKHAVFEGQVEVTQAGMTTSGERVEAFFAEPDATAPRNGENRRSNIAATQLLLSGGVHMSRGKRGVAEAMTCDDMIVDMTVDENGRNVPRLARLKGNVRARQSEPLARRSRLISANDEVLLHMASVPDPPTEQEQQLYQLAAQRCGYQPDSPEWKQVEARLAARRKLVATRIQARGDAHVTVKDPDPARSLDLTADTLDCQLTEDEQITHADINGSPDRQAEIDRGDFFIRGRHIAMDLNAQSLDVPGAGTMRFHTNKDLDGRVLREPVPVTVTWADGMTMRGHDNRGTFRGKVRAMSRNSVMDCNELRMEFAEDQNPDQAMSTADQEKLWVFRPLVKSLRGRPDGNENVFGDRIRKRPTHLHAIGDAVILSTSFEEAVPPGGIVTRFMATYLPENLGFAAPADDDQPQGRLLSRVRVQGPQIAADLVKEHFGVEGAGNLLVEDYRLPAKGASTKSARSSGASPIALGESLGGRTSPSQTLFTWSGSMSFLNDRNTARFERDVEMAHHSGDKMVLSTALASAMQVDPQRLGEGRVAGLACGDLLVEFERRAERRQGPSPLSEATELKSFTASERVRLESGNRSAEGERMSYNTASGEVNIDGTRQVPAKVMELIVATGRMRSWAGESLTWNQKDGTIHARGSNITATGR